MESIFDGDNGNGVFKRDFVISNRLGLHARAAARLVQVVQGFESEIFMEKDGDAVDAGSVLSLLTLECPLGTRVTVKASGNDAAKALDAVAELIENRFGEE